MEKFGVEEEETLTKTSTVRESRTCPSCGEQLKAAETTNVLACPKCGTRPFEGEARDARPRKNAT